MFTLTKYDSKTEHATLAHLSDGTMKSGYIGQDVLYYTHICYPSMLYTYELLLCKIKKEKIDHMVIVETGCASHGTSSTILWDNIVSKYGGTVISIDINEETVMKCREKVSDRVHVVHSDSISYLKQYQGPPIDFVYLDSFDCNFYQDNGSSLHHLFEFMQIEKHLKDGALILIDDTPIDKWWLDNASQIEFFDKIPEGNILWTKGKYVLFYLQKYSNSKILEHKYQVLIEYHR